MLPSLDLCGSYELIRVSCVHRSVCKNDLQLSRHTEEATMRRMLVAADGSECAARALKHLAERLEHESSDTDIHVLHVQPPLPESLPYNTDPALLSRMRDDEAEAATRWVHDLLERHGLRHRIEVETGDPATVIAEYARAHDCDEIVMGTRGLSTMKRLVLGSVANKVVHLADRPVLLVK
jgi:nucleotide-binding universal stress UspA family protein